MGVCYKLILEDEFDWGYSETSREERLKEFETKYDGYIERIADWYGFVVYDVEKSVPYTKERTNLISEYSDRAYYIDDLGSGIQELYFLNQKPSDKSYMDDITSRRTEEEKRASEAMIREKLKNMGDLK